MVRAQVDQPASEEVTPSETTTPKESVNPPNSAGFPLPDPLPAVPVVEPPDGGQYVLEFNRSPVVGNRFRMDGIYDEAQLRFTRPRNWKTDSVKVQLRFRHSPALYATRSNLTVLVNGTSIGSVPMNQPEGRIADVVFNVPPGMIQDYNEVTIAALQNNSPTCTQDPYDPSLWSEIMPDSKIVFNFQPQPINLNFSLFPYPIFDVLSLESNQIAYLQPKTIDETWLTTTARFHTALGRIAQYRAMDTRLVTTIDDVKEIERLIVIGTPENFPALNTLELPLSFNNNKVLDGKQQPLPENVGVLMLTTTADNRVPVLVATGNGTEGVAKAVQFLVQPHDQQIATGNVILVNQLTELPAPPMREWEGYLPPQEQFSLSDLTAYGDRPYEDITVRGSHAPAVEFDFRALPDDRFLPGSFMTLNYSYGPQVNPLTSLVEVELDNVVLSGKRLESEDGATQQSLRVDLPHGRIKPNSKMQVNFRLDPRERRSCSRVTDQQLWGTIHASTDFDLNRESVTRIPDLRLLQSAYPFAAPQDLSSTAIVLPENPTPSDLLLMLKMGERLGRLSRGDSVQLAVYRANQLPPEQRQSHHLIAIGTQAEFPFPDTLRGQGFALQQSFSRQWEQSQVQTFPDADGVLKEVVSPWNDERVLLILGSQTEKGLSQVRDLISHDPLFYQIEGDTVLISANNENPSPYSDQDYTLQFLRQAPRREVATESRTEQFLRFVRSNWFVLAPGLVVAALILYGVTQLFLKKLSGQVR
ncbi:MAG: cellulose biosynthesis cyclic di-GMP-binding regulatory protein BcsB [Cyanobacteria bacterium CRU_2_1]|nr:cellulose biosynthesis cyclic di-GMP-binding regulatory protein BcsB [Cyanobacteria bacterium CRU_2_1]